MTIVCIRTVMFALFVFYCKIEKTVCGSQNWCVHVCTKFSNDVATKSITLRPESKNKMLASDVESF